MIALPRLRSDELVGLVMAIAAHLALIVALTIHALRAPAIIPPPPRVTVSLAEDAGLVNEGPQIAQEAQAAVAPTLAENPEPAPPPAPAPEPKPVPKPEPKPQPKPKPSAKPTAKPSPKSERKPDPPRVSPAAQQRAVTPPPVKRPPTPPQPQATKAGGGSRLGDNFLKGAGDSEAAALVPASQIGAGVKASLFSQIAREIRPHWQPPSGADAEKLVTVIRFRLNPDGTLAGRPTVVTQRNVTDTNRPQAGRHAELAVRAIQLAAPFNLDPQYYEAWKSVGPLDFDWKLSQ
ncbi:MAG TPA: energy transducer TonB [Sphingomonadaceae bacterium]|nr:energy transducer TonB [Sphingomonadaceae bacterium]